MRYLIDGYNLLHALGLARKSGGRAAWDGARRQLLDWLADQFGETASDVTVAFDAQKAVGGRVAERFRGLHVLREGGWSADDLIEDLLRDEPSPETLTIVSNDTRVRGAATQHGVANCKCGEFVDQLFELHRKTSDSSVDLTSKPVTPPTLAEHEEWLRAFGG